ncbi:hypothetical protein C5167_040426 [Papaver somniferum]|uniref:RRM Nup35-type domain-containing protein n=1 Tax=Papaver somniferum TaxID=3469 RepID=A0A4Y7IHC9_PAPSO|nr:hypothetical protein C5167_040426 [Papaver somniferum]
MSRFRQRDIKLVLSEFEKCGWILEHVAGSDAANWVHILYQNRSDAQIALSKSGMQMNKNVILGVKSVDPMKRQELDAERIKKRSLWHLGKLQKFKRGRENCKSCWAEWSAVSDASRYLNLAAYATESEDDQDSEDASSGEDEDEGESDEDEEDQSDS